MCITVHLSWESTHNRWFHTQMACNTEKVNFITISVNMVRCSNGVNKCVHLTHIFFYPVPTQQNLYSLRLPCNYRAYSLQWRHNERDDVSNHQPHDCLLNLLFRRRSKKTSKLRVAGLCEGNSLVTGEFPAQKASNAKTASIWWRHHVSISVPTSLSSPWPRHC